MNKLLVLGVVLTAILTSAFFLITKLSHQQAVNIQPSPIPTSTPSSSTKEFSTVCQTDNDCTLINEKYGLGCCYEGACQEIDYAKDGWIAVNSSEFNKQKEAKCGVLDKSSRIDKCGPAPMCAVRVVDENYQAKCVDNKCQKVPLE